MANRILNDVEVLHAILKDDIVVTPLVRPDQVGGTIDLRLGTEFVVKRMDRLTHFDPVRFNKEHRKDAEAAMQYYETIKRVEPNSYFVLHPGQFALGCTLEYIRLSKQIGGQLEGRSSWAREGLNVHSTAGLIHPGHEGVIVFELQNAGTHPLPLYPGIRVAQLWLYELSDTAKHSYSDENPKYLKDIETTYGRPWEDWDFDVLADEPGDGAV
jgi:dCTP deaminase